MEITGTFQSSSVQIATKEASYIRVNLTILCTVKQFHELGNFHPFSVVHDGFLDPLNHTDNPEYWSGPYMDDLLNFMGVAQSSVVRNFVQDEYFYDWQIGSQEDMTPGLVDVSLKKKNFLTSLHH